MMKRLLVCGLILGIPLLPVAAQEGPKVVETTDWLPRHQFQRLLSEKNKRDDGGKGSNFWTKGHSVSKVEGQWKDGYQCYRAEFIQNPEGKGFMWRWYYDMSKETFQKRLSELGAQGYQLVAFSQNTTPAGGDSFVAVWNKKSEE